MQIDLYWYDLTPETQEDIARLLHIHVTDVPAHTDWDVIPITTITLEDLT